MERRHQNNSIKYNGSYFRASLAFIGLVHFSVLFTDESVPKEPRGRSVKVSCKLYEPPDSVQTAKEERDRVTLKDMNQRERLKNASEFDKNAKVILLIKVIPMLRRNLI